MGFAADAERLGADVEGLADALLRFALLAVTLASAYAPPGSSFRDISSGNGSSQP